ncbi:MAG: hypothetical protein HYZ53_09150 [Planctomycetes bacterium]|nr:hypothetical protein [Planctomycetota bacterium]
MKLDSEQLKKSDGLLRARLENASPDEVIVAILTLGQLPSETGSGPEAAPLDPADYPSRAAYREELLRRRAASSGASDATLRDLEALDLKPRGGQIGRLVVIAGVAGRIAQALKLTGVRSATIDREVRLPPLPEGARWS